MKAIPGHAQNKRVSNSRQRKQQHLLDVKLRESKERERRVRTVAGFIFKTLLLVSLAAGAWFGGKEALRRFVWENPDYFLRDVRFTTDGTLTREQMLAASGISEGVNIFTVDLASVRAAIEKLPQVESAEVQRLLPNRMTVAVTERRPVAWVTAKADEDPTSSDRAFLIDARGNVMRTRTNLPGYYHFPVISGVETENLVPGQRVHTFEMQSALELVRLNAESTRFQVRNIDLAKGYCMVVTDQKRARITFGLDGIELQLARLNRLIDAIEPTHKEIQTVNLLVERNVPVTFFDPDADHSSDEGAPPKNDGKDAKSKGAPGASDKAAAAGKPGATPSQTGKKQAISPGRSPSPSQVKKPFRLNQ